MRAAELDGRVLDELGAEYFKYIFVTLHSASGELPARRQLLCGNTATMGDLSCCIVAIPGIAVIGRYINKPVDSSDVSSSVIAANWDV